jgi:hypothetical protein
MSFATQCFVILVILAACLFPFTDAAGKHNYLNLKEAHRGLHDAMRTNSQMVDSQKISQASILQPAPPPTNIIHKYDERDDEDYYAQFEDGFEEEPSSGKKPPAQQPVRSRQATDEDNNDPYDSDLSQSKLTKSVKETSGIFAIEGVSSSTSSLATSEVFPASNLVIGCKDTHYISNYNRSSQESTPKSPTMTTPLTQSNSAHSYPGQSPSRRTLMSTSFSPRSSEDNPFIHLKSSKKGSVDISRSPDGPSARRSQKSIPNSPTTNAIDIIGQYAQHQNPNSGNFYNIGTAGSSPLIAIKHVNEQTEFLQKQAKFTDEVYSSRIDPVIQDFEDLGSCFRPYLALPGNYKDDCLDWYIQSRFSTTLIPPNLSESSFLQSTLTPKQFRLSDGAAHFFEPIDLYRAQHRMLLIQAIGPHFTVKGETCVVPVLLKTGQVVGFWQSLKEVPWPRWRPVLWLRLSLPFPFQNNSLDLVKEQQLIPEKTIHSRYYEDLSSDFLLERAALELSVMKDGVFPVSVEMSSFKQLAHLVGWRIDKQEAAGWVDLAMQVDDAIAPLFKSFQIQRSTFDKTKLVPKRIKTLTTAKYQGQYLASFPSLFNYDASINHLLLLPGGRRNWMEGTGNQKFFQTLFGPFIIWLTDPLYYPCEYEPLKDIEKAGREEPSREDCRVVRDIRDTFPAVKSPTSSDPIFTASHLNNRTYGPVSLLRIPKKIQVSDAPLLSPRASRSSVNFASSTLTNQPIPHHSKITKHNPIVDLLQLEDEMHAFQDACIAEQLTACAAAEILFTRLVYRCCVLINSPPESWIEAPHVAKASANLTAIRIHFTNQVNWILGNSQKYQWSRYSSFESISVGEAFIIYHRITNMDV